MFCIKCGKKLEEWDLFCPDCGTKVDKTDVIHTDENRGEKKHSAGKKKRYLVIAIIAGFAALLGIGIFVYLHFFSYRSVKIESCDGDVTLERKDEDKEIFEGLKLIPDDEVATGEDGTVELLIDTDKHLVAAENTCFSINAAGNVNSGKVTIKLEYGSALATIDEKLNEDSEFEIETPNCTCSVRGTTFEVAYDPVLHRSRVDVMDGVVRVKAGEHEIDVNAGESVIVEDETIYTVSGDTDAEVLTPLGGEIADDGSVNREDENAEGTVTESGAILRVPQTVENGIIHHAYYEVPLEDNMAIWLDEVIDVCERNDKEGGIALVERYVESDAISGIKEAVELLKDTYPEICSEFQWDKDMVEEYIHIMYKDYRCCWILGGAPGVWSSEMYFLPETGTGYCMFFRLAPPDYSLPLMLELMSCECDNGMFNGRLNHLHYSIDTDGSIDDYSTTCDVTNGLMNGMYESPSGTREFVDGVEVDRSAVWDEDGFPYSYVNGAIFSSYVETDENGNKVMYPY